MPENPQKIVHVQCDVTRCVWSRSDWLMLSDVSGEVAVVWMLHGQQFAKVTQEPTIGSTYGLMSNCIEMKGLPYWMLSGLAGQSQGSGLYQIEP